MFFSFFFFNDTATTEIYTLSLHDALPISAAEIAANDRSPDRDRRAPSPAVRERAARLRSAARTDTQRSLAGSLARRPRSEEHTSELQSPCNLVCRLLLEKKKNTLNSHCSR